MTRPLISGDEAAQRGERGGHLPAPYPSARLWYAGWPLFPILLLAALLRLAWPGLTPFSYDEARLATLAVAWAEGGPLPLAGMISSIGVSNPPLSVYLLALPATLSPDPLWLVAFVSLLNVAAVGGWYGLTYRAFGRTAAWVSALLFAVSPWALLYGRWLWAQSLLPPFVLLAVAAGYFALVEERSRWLVVLPVAVGLTLQLHFSGAVMVLWMAMALLLFRQRVCLRPLLVGVGLAALTWLPYLLHLRQHGAEELQAALARVGQPARVDGEILHAAWLTATGSQIHSLAGPEQFRAFLRGLPPYDSLFILLGLLVVAGVAWLLWIALRGLADKQREAAQLLLLWLAAPLLLFAYHSVDLPPHYVIVLFPALFVGVGVLVAGVQESHPMGGRGVAGGVLLIAASQVVVFVALLNFVGTRATPGGLGTPLHYWREAAATVREIPVCEVKVLGPGSWPDYHAQPAIWNLLLRDGPPLSFLEAAVEESLPSYDDGRTLVVVPPPPPDAAGYRTALPTAESALSSLPLRPAEGEILFLYRDGGRSEAVPMPFEAVRFANEMQLLGYALHGRVGPGQTLRIFLHWQLGELPATGEIFVYNHLLDSQGVRVGQADGPLCPIGQWRAGQRVWLWYDLVLPPDTPAGPYQLRSGLYTFPEVVTIATLGEDGLPAGDGVWLALPEQ